MNKGRFIYTPKVGALDSKGDIHFDYEIDDKQIKIYATKYNLQTHTFTRIDEPIFVKELKGEQDV
jgi:hypothetical protein|tara:strand:- start:82 stop:276 length:195 start_codon:yes stop_codon:yes gene_type:complete